MPTVSVIIPAYNHCQFIVQTLESVFAQTYTDYEVIVVNDGSPDATGRTLQPWVASGRVRYFEQPNAGQAAARNRGVAEARGTFIAFLDDDDTWPADKLQWQTAALSENPRLDAVVGRAQFVGPSGEKLDYVSEFHPQLTAGQLFQGNPIISPGQALLRASALHHVGGLDPTLWGVDDWDLWFKLARTGPIPMHDRVALLYRVHSANATRQARRLYYASRRVVARHLTTVPKTDRREMRKRGYVFMRDAWPSRLTSNVKESLRLGNVSQSLQDLIALLSLLRMTPVLPSVLPRVIAELLPMRLRLKFRRTR